jgi:hypothetical protein
MYFFFLNFFLKDFFSNKKSILKIKSKIIIFHAEDDWFVPISHAIELAAIAEKRRPKEFPKVELVKYGKELGLGHFVSYHGPFYEKLK